MRGESGEWRVKGMNRILTLVIALACGLGMLLNAETARGKGFEGEPFFKRRILNHWDNLDGTIERGYAGRSLWKWDELPETVSPRYAEYAGICAEAGINGIISQSIGGYA